MRNNPVEMMVPRSRLTTRVSFWERERESIIIFAYTHLYVIPLYALIIISYSTKKNKSNLVKDADEYWI